MAKKRQNDSTETGSLKQWSSTTRFVITATVFIVLLAMLSLMSAVTNVPVNHNPTNQTIPTLATDTAVVMEGPANPEFSADCPVTGKQGSYKIVTEKHQIVLDQPSTGATQDAGMLIRYPQGCTGKHPGVVFMHGAGYGTAENSFNDVATALSSAGFVTATVDKPVWETTDITRDYPGSAAAYDQVAQYLRSREDVAIDEVGVYATSESAWISPDVIADDGDIAFQILLSPMLMSPRLTLGFFVAQDFSIVGAHPGYQNLVSTICSWDLDAVGLHNIDIDPGAAHAQTYAIPTFLAYGSKDVMTAQVEGTYDVLAKAMENDNLDVTVRNYPLASHVLRIGDEAKPNTKLADHYVDDMVAWASGVVNGQAQTTPRVAGATIRQSIAVPTNFHSSTSYSLVFVVLFSLMVIFLIIAVALSIVAIPVGIVRRVRYHRRSVVTDAGTVVENTDAETDAENTGVEDIRETMRDFKSIFVSRLVGMALLGIGGLAFYGAAIGITVWGLVKIVWGAAPLAAGYIDWSWYIVQGACVLAVLMLAQFITRFIEVKHLLRAVRHHRRYHHRGDALSDGAFIDDTLMDGRQCLITSTRFTRFYSFVIIALTVVILLLLASWGVFLA